MGIRMLRLEEVDIEEYDRSPEYARAINPTLDTIKTYLDSH